MHSIIPSFMQFEPIMKKKCICIFRFFQKSLVAQRDFRREIRRGTGFATIETATATLVTRKQLLRISIAAFSHNAMRNNFSAMTRRYILAL